MTDDEALMTTGTLVREALGLNRNAAAMKCGIQHQPLSAVEDGRRPAGKNTCRALERGLGGVTCAWTSCGTTAPF